MAADLTFQPARDRGWVSGLGTLLRKETSAFWGTRTCWVQLGAWTLLIQGLLLNSVAQAHHGPPGTEFVSVGMGTFGALGMIVITHNAIVGEKQSGTAAWIMSKPVSRTAFILAKFLAALTGPLTVVVAVEGTVAYAVLAATGHAPAVLTYLRALAAVAIYLLFFAALSLCLGTLFTSGGPCWPFRCSQSWPASSSTSTWQASGSAPAGRSFSGEGVRQLRRPGSNRRPGRQRHLRGLDRHPADERHRPVHPRGVLI